MQTEALSLGRARLRSPHTRTAAKAAILFFAGSLIWQFSNFLFNAVAAHLLGPADYGTLAAVVGLLYLANPLFVSLQTVAARMTTSLEARGAASALRGYLRYYGLRLGAGGLFAACLLALSSGPISQVLNLPSRTPVALLSLILLLSTGTHLQRGVLLGSQRFKLLGLSSAVEGVTKVTIAGIFLTWMWHSVNAAVVAVTLAALVGFGVNWMLLRWLPRGEDSAQPNRHPSRYSLVTLLNLGLLAALLSMDVIAAHRYLSFHVAGLYAASSLGGKIVFFALSTVALYLFPKFSSQKDRGLDARRPLALSLILVSFGASVLIACFFLMPRLVIDPLFGAKFSAAAQYLGWMALAFGLYGLVYLTSMYLLSQRRAIGAAILGVMLLSQLFSFLIFHSTVWSFVWTEVAVFSIGTAILCGFALLSQPTHSDTTMNAPNPLAA